jgi:hypothetical protein
MTEGGALGKAGVRRRGRKASCGVYILFKNGMLLDALTPHYVFGNHALY